MLKIGYGGGFGQAHLFVQESCSVRDGPDQGHLHIDVKSQKRQKKAIY